MKVKTGYNVLWYRYDWYIRHFDFDRVGEAKDFADQLHLDFAEEVTVFLADWVYRPLGKSVEWREDNSEEADCVDKEEL